MLLLLSAVFLCAVANGQEVVSLSGEPVELSEDEAVHVHLVYFYTAAELPRLCALESTLRSNPGALVHVHTASVREFIASYKRTPLRGLHPSRVVVHKTSFPKLFQGTPLQDWYGNDTHTYDRPGQQLANGARLAILQKYGGIYMDLDYIVQKDLSSLPRNYMALQSHASLDQVKSFKGHVINNAFLRFAEPDHPFLGVAMTEFVRGYKERTWGNQGPGLMTRVYNTSCVRYGKLASWCSSLTVGGYQAVYPSPFPDFWWRRGPNIMQYKPVEEWSANRTRVIKEALAVHFWSHLWGKDKKPVCLSTRSFAANLFAEWCPICYTALVECNNKRTRKK